MNTINVRPAALRQFTDPADTFCLVTDADHAGDFTVSDDGRTRRTMVIAMEPGDDLGSTLSREVPEAADVLVICRRAFLSSPDPSAIGPNRRLVIMPCASTPVSLEHIRYFLRVAERTDPAAQARQADRFFSLVAAASGLRVVDEFRETACEFNPFGGDYVWNQQAGAVQPGEQQIAPAGELSVLPMEITGFDADRALALNGTLTIAGWPIVHAGYETSLADDQERIYQRLLPLHRHPVRFAVRDGVIVDCQDPVGSAEGADLVAAFDELFSADPRYGTIWELGFGINNEMAIMPANCGLNEPYGAGGGVIHIGLGLTPYTQFALTFLCPASALIDESGQVLLGRVGRVAGEQRIRPVRRAACGCQYNSTMEKEIQ
jgi:hypothetical protein